MCNIGCLLHVYLNVGLSPTIAIILHMRQGVCQEFSLPLEILKCMLGFPHEEAVWEASHIYKRLYRIFAMETPSTLCTLLVSWADYSEAPYSDHVPKVSAKICQATSMC